MIHWPTITKRLAKTMANIAIIFYFCYYEYWNYLVTVQYLVLISENIDGTRIRYLLHFTLIICTNYTSQIPLISEPENH